MKDHYALCNAAGSSHRVQRPSRGQICKCSLTSLRLDFWLATAECNETLLRALILDSQVRFASGITNGLT